MPQPASPETQQTADETDSLTSGSNVVLAIRTLETELDTLRLREVVLVTALVTLRRRLRS